MFDTDNIKKLLLSFNTITGIKTVVYDAEYNEIISVPDRHSSFCRAVRDKYSDRVCEMSGIGFCKKAQSIGGLYLGRCHAGLIEAAFPLVYNCLTVGYIMFGQIMLPDDKINIHSENGADAPVIKTHEEIDACTDLLRAIANYIILKYIIDKSKNSPGMIISEYISGHLDMPLSVDELAKKFGMSRSELYQKTAPFMPGGIKKYIKNLRMAKAMELLANSDMSFKRIAEKTGYSDSAYFAKDFKKHTGFTLRIYRAQNRSI